jgi:hypothetical protein
MSPSVETESYGTVCALGTGRTYSVAPEKLPAKSQTWSRHLRPGGAAIGKISKLRDIKKTEDPVAVEIRPLCVFRNWPSGVIEWNGDVTTAILLSCALRNCSYQFPRWQMYRLQRGLGV